MKMMFEKQWVMPFCRCQRWDMGNQSMGNLWMKLMYKSGKVEYEPHCNDFLNTHEDHNHGLSPKLRKDIFQRLSLKKEK